MGTALLAVLAVQAVLVPKYTGKAITDRVDPAITVLGERLDARDKQIDALILAMSDLTEGNKKNLVRVQSMFKSGAEIMHYVRWQILPQVNSILASANVVAGSMRQDVPKLSADLHNVLVTVNADAGKLGTLIDSLNAEILRVQTLTETLDREIKANSEQAGETWKQLTKAIEDLDKLVSGDDVKGILANSNAGTKSLAEGLESINQALMPLRKKISLLKMLLGKAISIIKLDPSKW